MAGDHPADAPEPLTPRESEVLELLRLGLTNEEIARELGISLDGAKYHVSQIIGKLGVRDRHEAARWSSGRPWWAVALTPVTLFRRGLGALLPVKLSAVAAGASAAVVALLVCGLGFVAFLLLRGEAHEKDPPADRSVWLMTEGRSDLSICVDAVGSEDNTQYLRTRVDDALDHGLSSLDEVPQAYGSPSVTSGCPAAGLELGPSSYSYAERRALAGKNVSDTAQLSPHRLFVYFVAADLYASYIGEGPYVRVPAEFLCEGDACAEMTVGLYVPVSIERTALTEAMFYGLGLYRHPEEPLDWSVCEQGELAAPYCSSYEDYKEWRQTQEAVPTPAE